MCDYFGWTVWTGLFTGDIGWTNAHEIPNPEDFEPNEEGWAFLYGKLQNALEEAGLKGKLGTCFHTSKDVPPILKLYDYVDDFYAATDKYMAQPGVKFDFGLHAAFGFGEFICGRNFTENLRKDIESRKLLKYGNVIVEHPDQLTRVSKTPKMVDILSTDPVISMIEDNDIVLSWENMPGYAREKKYYSSLKHLLEFREALSDRYQDLGMKHLINKHLFCLDTGHLLIWRNSQQNIRMADRELDEYLPQFAKLTNVFHYHTNEGTTDNHMAPGAWAFENHPSRQWINKDRFMQNSEQVYEWIKICEDNKGMDGRHLHLEAGTTPFTLDGYIEFGKRLADLI